MVNIKQLIAFILITTFFLCFSIIEVDASPTKLMLTMDKKSELETYFTSFSLDGLLELHDYDSSNLAESNDSALTFAMFSLSRSNAYKKTSFSEDEVEDEIFKLFGISVIQHRTPESIFWFEYRSGIYYVIGGISGSDWHKLNVIEWQDNGNETFSALIEISVYNMGFGDQTDIYYDAAIVQPYGNTYQLLYWKNNVGRDDPLPVRQPTTAAENSMPISQAVKMKIAGSGRTFDVPTYTINGTNYFQLRNLETLLNYTVKKINVSNNGSIPIITVLGFPLSIAPISESDFQYNDGSINSIEKGPKISIDGVYKSIDSYLINNKNYVQLRDFSKSLGEGSFGIGYDGTYIIIDPNAIYVDPIDFNALFNNRSESDVWNLAYWSALASSDAYLSQANFENGQSQNDLNAHLALSSNGFTWTGNRESNDMQISFGVKDVSMNINGRQINHIVAISVKGTGSNWTWPHNAAADINWNLTTWVNPNGTYFFPTTEGPLVHKGILDCYKEVKNNLLPQLGDEYNFREDVAYWISGHSLGGAVGELLALDLIENNIPPEHVLMYGIASLNPAHESLFNTSNQIGASSRIYKIWSEDDLIQQTPSLSFNTLANGANIKTIPDKLIGDWFDSHNIDKTFLPYIIKVAGF